MGRADPAAPLSGRRLFAPALPEPGQGLLLSAEAAQHARVLRLSEGDVVELFDGQGGTAAARVEALARSALSCVGLTPIVRVPRPPRVVLVQCLPRAGKLDDIVRMTTEIGVSAIMLAVSERSVARATGDAHKRERLERVASEAARQSEQAYLPEIAAPAPLGAVLARAPREAYRAACVERSAAPLPERVEASELWLAIGPEGGLSPADRALLADAGFRDTALGRSILRTETAAVVGVALAVERLGRGR